METTTLSYDDASYEKQVKQNLKDRLGNTKVYLYEDVAKSTKRVAKLLEEEDGSVEEELVTSDGRRLNALTLTGLPISRLKTQAIFAYSAHFDSAPTGLEWINDRSVVFVYSTTKAARVALRNLRKFLAEDPDEDELFTAKPIPVSLWPPGSRVNISLGAELDEQVRDLRQRICIRIARSTDVKEKGAQSVSEFYKKHGRKAGKEMYEFLEHSTSSRGKRRRDDHEQSEQTKRARLDAELDTLNNEHTDGELDREDTGFDSPLKDRISGSVRHCRRIRGKIPTKQSLDDELDAFLRDRD